MAKDKKPTWIEIIVEAARELGGEIRLGDPQTFRLIRQKAVDAGKNIPLSFRQTLSIRIHIHANSKLNEKYKSETQYFEDNEDKIGTWRLLEPSRPMPLMKIIERNISEIQETNKKILTKTEMQALIKIRLGQGRFRDELWKKWKGCSVTGYRKKELLRASHIKPWSRCDNSSDERLDVDNGLLLIPNIDLAFDHGFISFDDEGKIMISNKLKNAKKLEITSDMKLRRKLNKKQKEYLQYHRENIFKKEE